MLDLNYDIYFNTILRFDCDHFSHIENFKNNNILLKKNQIKYLLQKYREEKFPSNDKYLIDISKINITYDEKNINLINLPFCYRYTSFININDNNKLDKYIIFTTNFQINMLQKSTQILIDGTFKSCPKGYMQILNIAGYIPDIDSIIPIFMIPVTGKSENLYNRIFKEVKEIITDMGYKLENITSHFMSDFEKALQNSIRNNFPHIKLDGC